MASLDVFYVRSIHLNSEQCVCETSGSRNINQLDGGDLLSSFSAYSVCINTSCGYEKKKKKWRQKRMLSCLFLFVAIQPFPAYTSSSTNIWRNAEKKVIFMWQLDLTSKANLISFLVTFHLLFWFVLSELSSRFHRNNIYLLIAFHLTIQKIKNSLAIAIA